jgi:hypothetical protein
VSTCLVVDTTCVRWSVASGPLVDLVGEDVFGESKADGVVEAGQQLRECLVLAADEHRDRDMLVCGRGYASDGIDDADGDFSVLDEAGEIGQEIRDRVGNAGRFRALFYAASSFSGCRLRAKF